MRRAKEACLEPQQFWEVIRLGAASRLLDRLRPWERTATDEEMADALHLLGEMAEIKPLSPTSQGWVCKLLQNGALGAALRSGDLLWLGSFLTLRSVPGLESLLLTAVRDHLTGTYRDTVDVLPLARLLQRHGQSGHAPIKLAPEVAALVAEAHLRQPDAGWSRERARLAWLALDEWLSLLSKSLAKCETGKGIDKLVAAAGRAMVGVNEVAHLLDGTHRVAGDIHVAGVAVAHMTALNRLEDGRPDLVGMVAVAQHLGRVRKAIDGGGWPLDPTAELEQRMEAVAGRLLTLSGKRAGLDLFRSTT